MVGFRVFFSLSLASNFTSDYAKYLLASKIKTA